MPLPAARTCSVVCLCHVATRVFDMVRKDTMSWFTKTPRACHVLVPRVSTSSPPPPSPCCLEQLVLTAHGQKLATWVAGPSKRQDKVPWPSTEAGAMPRGAEANYDLFANCALSMPHALWPMAYALSPMGRRRGGGGKDSRTISAASAAVKRGVCLRSDRRKRLVSFRCPKKVSKGPASNGPASNGDEPGGQPSPPAACCARSTPRRGAAGTPAPCPAPNPARRWKQPKSCTNGGLVPVSAFVPAAFPLALAFALTL
jgi:hypothetical protein